MNLKKTIIKYLLILAIIQVIINLIQIFRIKQYLIMGDFLYSLIYGFIFILIINDLYKIKSRFSVAAVTVLLYPIIILFIKYILGNIFIQFCSDSSNDGFQGIEGLIKIFDDPCNFTIYFDPFQPIFDLYLNFNYVFIQNNYLFLGNLILSPYIFYPFIFNLFVLFKYFEMKRYNPYWSFIPIINKLNILKICNLPLVWVLILFIPFIRLFWFYKINLKLCQVEGISKSNSIWMTLFPWVFYGKLIFK